MVRYDYRQRYQDAKVALEVVKQLLNKYQAPTFTTSREESFSPPPSQTSVLTRILQVLQQLFGVGGKNSQPSGIVPQSTLPAESWEQPEGVVSLDSAFYVERSPIEADCYGAILQPGALIRIKAPRQMGKSSLLTRILHQSRKHGYQTAYMNFQSADAESFTSLDIFLQWFCNSITDKLNLTDKVAEYWRSVLGSKGKCINYFEKYLLSTITSPVVLGLDEVDQIFQYPELAADFFALLRVWHEMSQNEEIWKKLRLVIVHSKEVYISLNINQSPFNVGLPIELPEFNTKQVEDLVQRHKLYWTHSEVMQLMTMVGGHPYLVRKALSEIARGRTSLAELLQTAPTEEGMYSAYLRRHLSNLLDDANLVAAFKQVVASPHPVRIERDLAFRLRSMRLVKFIGNDVVPLCDLYRQYFCDRLGV
ncbi:MAG: AAA-like domain-containing protein [Stigonema ocellatum SAG 48.90 = DSM 106950]|nr:AAA-like domain-containing protein [Stigonema ocellatum SAG 48.90 = DSM 106950]